MLLRYQEARPPILAAGLGRAPQSKALPEQSFQDPVLQQRRDAIQESRYKSLLDQTEIWLPGDYDLTFRTLDPTGRKTDFAFTWLLYKELIELNERTWNADMATLSRWYKGEVGIEDEVEASARHGFARTFEHARIAYLERLPMVLDF